MRRDDRNIGAREGLLDEKHRRQMGPARHLFDWLLARQTDERAGVGLVLGGAPITYLRIVAETEWPMRTVQRWMRRLAARGYIELSYVDRKRMVIVILRAKKFTRPSPQPARPTVSPAAKRVEACRKPVQKAVNCGGNPVQSGPSYPPKVADHDPPKVADMTRPVLMCGVKEMRERESQQQETAATAPLSPAAVGNGNPPPLWRSGHTEFCRQCAEAPEATTPTRPGARASPQSTPSSASSAVESPDEAADGKEFAEAARAEFFAALCALGGVRRVPGHAMSERQSAARRRRLEKQRQELLRRPDASQRGDRAGPATPVRRAFVGE